MTTYNTLIKEHNKNKDDIVGINSQLAEIIPNTTLFYLQDIDNIRTRAIISVQGFYDIDEDSNGKYRVLMVDGTEVWKTVVVGINSFKISTNGDIAQNKTLTTVDKKLRYIPKEFVNVKMFGAFGDSTTDDTTSLQSAINYFLENSTMELLFPSGTYCISAPLDCYKNGRYINIGGTGYRDSMLKATSNMTHMLKLWNDGTYNQVYIHDIGFLMEDYADIGIDAFKTTYSTFDRISIWTIKSNSICLKLSSWCNRLVNSMLHGNYGYIGNTKGIVPATGLLIEKNLSTNNLIIRDNVFERLDTGIKTTDFINDVHIHSNTFDQVGKILIATNGTRHCTFKFNYCEGCGGSNTEQYTLNPITYTDGSYTRSLTSPLILHEDIIMVGKYLINIDISNNQFANCWNKKLVSVSGVKHLTFKDNSFYGVSSEDGAYTYSDVINVFGKGVRESYGGKLEVSNKYQEIDNFVVYDNNYSAYYRNDGDIIIYDNKKNISKNTPKPKIVPKINGVAITPEQDIIINSTSILRLDFELSELDRKNPIKIIINVENVSGTNITFSLFNKNTTTWIYEEVKNLTYNSLSFYCNSNEISTRQLFNFYCSAKSDSNVKIKSIFLQVANADNNIIQLL